MSESFHRKVRKYFSLDKLLPEDDLRQRLNLQHKPCADAFCHRRNCDHIVIEKKGNDTRGAIKQLEVTCKALRLREGINVKECILIADKVEKRFYRVVDHQLYLKLGNKPIHILDNIPVIKIRPSELLKPPLDYWRSK